MINENDAKTLGIAPHDPPKKKYTYRVTFNLVNNQSLTYTFADIDKNIDELMSALCVDRFVGFNVEQVAINMNLVTHINVEELDND